ncbi:unnamed protein product, partial [Durusdinium trenchii]
ASSPVGPPLAPPPGPPPPATPVPAPLADPNFIDPSWEVPTADETAAPKEDDGESWLELLRDGPCLGTDRTDWSEGPD